jgi:hypothetical protein
MSLNSKWKSGFLKTGLPLEYVTSNILNKIGYINMDEYPYIRPNESEELKEFSVDIRAYKTLESNNRSINLEMLVECKYRQPGTSWIFSPLRNEDIAVGLVQSTEDLVPVRLNGSDTMWNFEDSIGYCTSGIELNSNGEGNTYGSRHGVFQLRFAMPVLLKELFQNTLNHNFFNGRSIDLLCAVLVTTSELRVIKYGLDLEDFVNASNIDDVTEVREAIILNENPGPQLQEFSDSIADELLGKYPELQKRLSYISSVLDGDEWRSRSAPDVDTIKRSFGYSTERILIVNYNFFEKIIKELEVAITENIQKEKVYGKIIGEKDKISVLKV